MIGSLEWLLNKSIGEKQNDISTEIGRLHAKADNTHTEIGSLHAKADNTHTEIGSLHTKVNDVSAGIGGLYFKADNTHTEIGSLHTKVNDVSAGIGGLYFKADNAYAAIVGLYEKVDECIKLYSKLASPQDDFVYVKNGLIDYGGSFKEYFLKNNMPEKIAVLKEGLDEESKNRLDIYLNRFLYFPDGRLVKHYNLSKVFYDSLYTEEEKNFLKEFEDNPSQYGGFYSELGFQTTDAWVFHHGLKFSSNKVKEYIKNKDFIDGGAWIGDGVVMFNKHYNPNKIFAFEISPKNCECFKQTMNINRIPNDKYHLVPLGLGDKKENMYIADDWGVSTSILISGEKKTEVCLTDLDSYVNDNKINPGFIKANLEGYGLKALNGMVNTIRTHRPVLSLAIYHTPEEFFEMKPLLTEITKDINYRITLDRFSVKTDVVIDITIFAYPAELYEGEIL